MRQKKGKLKLQSRLAGQDEFLIDKNGIDPEFHAFGIRTAKINPSESKKLLSRSFILKNNLWLRFRALLGSNFRADIAYVRIDRLVHSANGAMKLLNCSKETNYRIWNALEDARVEELIRIS